MKFEDRSCGSGTTYYLPIKDEFKNQIPFSGSDTLKYISNLGDTAILFGLGRTDSVKIDYKSSTSNPDCHNVMDKYNIEYIDISYSGKSKHISKFTFLIERDYFYSTVASVSINGGYPQRGYAEDFNNLKYYNSYIYINNIKTYGVNYNQAFPHFIYSKYKGILSISIDSNLTYSLIN
jgi:hypothetical protein